MKLLEENTEKSPAVQPEPVESLEEKVDREVKEGEWKVPVKFARMKQQARTRPELKVTYVKDEINCSKLNSSDVCNSNDNRTLVQMKQNQGEHPTCNSSELTTSQQQSADGESQEREQAHEVIKAGALVAALQQP